MSDTISGLKSSIRQHHHTLRRSLRDSEWKEYSSRIIDKLMAVDEFRSASVVHTYVSMEKNREVYTGHLIQACIKSGKQVIVPRIKSEGELTHHEITSVGSLSVNKWGVYEPSKEDEVELPDNLLVVVPMVAADFNRERLGYGKGYYDRFLSSVNATKVGLCYNFNLSWTPLPTDSFDVKMDKIISDQFIL